MTVNRPLVGYTYKTAYSEEPPILRSTQYIFGNSAPFTKCKLVKLQNIAPGFPSFRIGLLILGEIYYFDENGEINFSLPDGVSGATYYLIVESSTMNEANVVYNKVIYAYSIQFEYAKYITNVDGGKQAITYYNNTEPCAVYVDGDLQENVSFVPQTVQGTGSVNYTSEYKKNHIQYELTGTTSQPIVDVVQSLTSYTATEEDYTESSYARILRSADLIYLPTGTTSADVSLTNVSSLANVPSNITFLLMNQARTVVNVLYMNGTSYSATVTEPFYIAIADEEDGNLKQSDYDTFIQNVSLEMTYNGSNIQPTPNAPLPIQNTNDNGMSVVVHGTNLATAQQIFANRADYTEEEFDGKNCIRFKSNKGVSNTIEGGFKENTQYTFFCQYYRENLTQYGDSSLVYRIVYTDGTRKDIYATTINKWVELTVTTEAGKTVKSINGAVVGNNTYIYIDIDTFQVNEGTQVLPYEPYFAPTTITIPTSITVGNTNVPLLMSEYDKLIVDRVKNGVIYLQGSFMYSYTGEEKNRAMQAVNGNGLNYQSFLEYVSAEGAGGFVNNIGYCTHFKKAVWNPLSAYGTYATRTYDVIFRTDGNQTLDEFKAYLQEQHANGTPVTIVKQRATPIKRDITNTDLGQQLLNLATQNQTNYIEISGNAKAPDVPINLTYAKWGELIENNNNT